MYVFKIENMHCMSCVRNIDDALKEFDSNILIKANVKDRTLSIVSVYSEEKLTKLIEEAGYSVTGLQKIKE